MNERCLFVYTFFDAMLQKFLLFLVKMTNFVWNITKIHFLINRAGMMQILKGNIIFL